MQEGRRAIDRSPTVLERVAAELADLHERMSGLQHVLGPLIAMMAEGDSVVMAAAQELDLVSQSLDGLAIFVNALEPGDQGLNLLDPIRASMLVKLDGMASRLAGYALPRQTSTEKGELELF